MRNKAIEKVLRKIEKREKLEESRKQFCQIPKAEQITYVWSGSTSFPMPLTQAR